jgi:hypothetical protein
VTRLLGAGTWVQPYNLSARGSGVTSVADALQELGIVQLDAEGRIALTREAYEELIAVSGRRRGTTRPS